MALPRRFYRSVKTDPPTVRDFMSYAELGKVPPRRDSVFLRRWAGLSVFTSLEEARANAANFNWRMGTLIVEISIPDDVNLEHDGPDERGHCNLFGLSATDLRNWVTGVFWGPSTQTPSNSS